MRLQIDHLTEYTFDAPLAYGLQELRLTPKSRPFQTIEEWQINIEGGRAEATFQDQHANEVTLISLAEGAEAARIHCRGVVVTSDVAGVVGGHAGFAPIWLFERETALTKPGAGVRKIAKDGGAIGDRDIDRLHALSGRIAEAAPYKKGATKVDQTAEGALAAKAAVCQDHAHIFIACARLMGYPARYVSGYLMLDEQPKQDAGHAWAEAHVPGLGWVGFDVSNQISPDERYVRVATGLDYREAAPISGVTLGQNAEALSVRILVEQ